MCVWKEHQVKTVSGTLMTVTLTLASMALAEMRLATTCVSVKMGSKELTVKQTSMNVNAMTRVSTGHVLTCVQDITVIVSITMEARTAQWSSQDAQKELVSIMEHAIHIWRMKLIRNSTVHALMDSMEKLVIR